MTRPDHRSPASQQRRYISRIISKQAYRDTRLAESINTLTTNQIETILLDKYGSIRTGLHLQLAQGVVTSDARGEGAFQVFDEDNEE